MAGRGGKGAGNVPKLKGALAQGSRPAGSSAVVPNGQGVVNASHGLVNLNQIGGNAVGGKGTTTVNSTPSKS